MDESSEQRMSAQLLTPKSHLDLESRADQESGDVKENGDVNGTNEKSTVSQQREILEGGEGHEEKVDIQINKDDNLINRKPVIEKTVNRDALNLQIDEILKKVEKNVEILLARKLSSSSETIQVVVTTDQEIIESGKRLEQMVDINNNFLISLNEEVEHIIKRDEVKLHVDEILKEVVENAALRSSQSSTARSSSTVLPLTDEQELDSGSSETSMSSKSTVWEDEEIDSALDYKDDESFTSFIKDFTSTVEGKNKLSFQSKILLHPNQDLFPPELILYDYLPTTVVCSNLQKIKIVAPNVLDYLKDISCKEYFRQALGENVIGFKLEESLRDRVIFILRCVQSKVLKSFILENEDDGKTLYPNDRMSIWEQRIRDFLIRHSDTLRSIHIRTVRMLGQTYRNYETVEHEYTFPHLKDFEVILWEKPQEKKERQAVPNALSNSYWVRFLQSRILYGHLRKLIWMSTEMICWNETFFPVILRNKETLSTIHILCMGTGNPSKEAVGISGSHLILTCAQFTEINQLNSLYLRLPQCFLTHLGLFPVNLQELSLDVIYLESFELIFCIQTLKHLNKLRLVDNIPTDINHGLIYGVNEEVIKVILQHRKLNELSIWGYGVDIFKNINNIKSASTLMPSFSKGNSNSKRSLFRKIQDFFSQRIKSRVKVDVMRISQVQRLEEILQEIAYISENSIIITEETNEKKVTSV